MRARTPHRSNTFFNKNANFILAYDRKIQVADDPETLRIKQNSKIISNVAYHGDLEKKAAMEKQREVTEVADNRGESQWGTQYCDFSLLNAMPSASDVRDVKAFSGIICDQPILSNNTSSHRIPRINIHSNYLTFYISYCFPRNLPICVRER